MQTAENVIELIGKTPIVKINRLNPHKNFSIFAKLEGQNIGGSIKDRIALAMIEDAEKSGELTPGKTILEPTSGNTGIGLAMIARVKGYNLMSTMPSNMSEERKKIFRAFGADLIETDPTQSTEGAIAKAQEIYEKNPEKFWIPNQFNNTKSPAAHFKGTAEEIISQVPEITHFVAGIGTGGTLMGCGARLREYNPQIKIIGAEPAEIHKIAGMRNMKAARGRGFTTGIYNEDTLDQK